MRKSKSGRGEGRAKFGGSDYIYAGIKKERPQMAKEGQHWERRERKIKYEKRRRKQRTRIKKPDDLEITALTNTPGENEREWDEL
jgi:hypothetical protein